jgi:antitoxin component YwqK of YwqJK toxin-antitoxin module
MERYIAKDLLTYIISDYVRYPHILYTQNLKLKECRKTTIFTNNDSIDNNNKLFNNNCTYKKIDNITVETITNYSDRTTTKTFIGNRIKEIKSVNGKIQLIIKYLNNSVHGYKLEYSEKAPYGLIKKQHYNNDYLNGKTIKYNANSLEIMYYNFTQLFGPYLRYEADILVEEKTYQCNIVVGNSKTYYKNGNIKTNKNYGDKGVEIGYCYEYDYDGKLIKVEYFNSKI